MFKSKLQEFCQRRRGMDLPVYATTKEGPPHDLCFQATVMIDDMQFHSHKPWKTTKDAQNDAARVALCCLSPPPQCPSGEKRDAGSSNVSFAGAFQLESKEANQTPLKVAPPVVKDFNKIEGSSDVSLTGTFQLETKEANQTLYGAPPFVKDDNKFEGAKHLYKNLLESFAQKKGLTLPVYSCERDGPPHASRFSCKVIVGSQIFASEEFVSNIKDAENAAAKVALMSLSQDGFQEDDPIVYKNLLQEFCQKEGCPLPVYTTTKSGEIHFPTFVSTVELKSIFFTGEKSRTKKRAEMGAAKVAYRALRENKFSQSPTFPSLACQRQEAPEHLPSDFPWVTNGQKQSSDSLNGTIIGQSSTSKEQTRQMGVTSISEYSLKAGASSHQQTIHGESGLADDSSNQLLLRTTTQSVAQLPVEDNTIFACHVVVLPRGQDMAFSSDCSLITSDDNWVAFDLKSEPSQTWLNAVATEYTVGDSNQWKNNKFDYQGWAKDKVFRVGDVLVFKYAAGKHNVVKVDGASFKNCTAPAGNEPLTSGEDRITLASPGRKWYICGVGDHCASGGQKLVLEVIADAPAPAPWPETPSSTTPPPTPNSAYIILSSAYQVFVSVAVLIAAIIM